MRLPAVLMLYALMVVSPAPADEASHRAAAERFLRLANAESMTVPLYSQTEQILTARFAQMGGSMQYESILRDYRRRARDMLDEQLSWAAMRDELVALYLPVFSEQEFDELSMFYQSPVGHKLLMHLPELTQASVAVARRRVEEVIAPQLEGLIDEMAAEVEERQGGAVPGAD